MTALTIAALTALAEPVLANSGEQEDTPRISNGIICAECGFGPSVVYLESSYYTCTGTLIHPQVILYAAHCGIHSQARFTHIESQGVTSTISYCKVHPDYQSESSEYDFAYCLLNNPVNFPYTPPAYGCEYDLFITTGQLVHVVGFGYHNNGQNDQFKRWAVSQITSVDGDNGYGTIRLGPYNGVVACPGDSGGPALVQGDDGAWRVVGVASTYGGVCGEGGSNRYAQVRAGVEWIEENSGIDITPCFDADGTWNPTKDCQGFWAGDDTGYGSWLDGCSGSPLSGPSDTCAYFDAGTDTDSDSDSDTDSDSDSDADAEDPAEDGCGCSKVGKTASRFTLFDTLFRIFF